MQDLKLNLVDLIKSAFCYLNPVILKVVLLEVPELSKGSIEGIHEHRDPHREPQQAGVLILHINRKVYLPDQHQSAAQQESVSHAGKEEAVEQ